MEISSSFPDRTTTYRNVLPRGIAAFIPGIVIPVGVVPPIAGEVTPFTPARIPEALSSFRLLGRSAGRSFSEWALAGRRYALRGQTALWRGAGWAVRSIPYAAALAVAIALWCWARWWRSVVGSRLEVLPNRIRKHRNHGGQHQHHQRHESPFQGVHRQPQWQSQWGDRSPVRINKAERVVSDVGVQVRLPRLDLQRILGDKAVEMGAVVASAVEVEPSRSVVLPPRVLEQVAARSAGGACRSEGIVSVLRYDGSRVVCQRDRRAEDVGQE